MDFMPERKKKILILAFNKINHDARILRQIHFLKDTYQCEVICYQAPEIPGVTFRQVGQTKLTLFRKAIIALCLKLGFFIRAYWLLYDYKSLVKEYAQRRFDLILANDIETMPLACALAQEAKILFDAHEYYPRHFENKLSWRFFFMPFNQFLCKKYIPMADGMMAVAEGIAREYEKHFQVKPEVITNAPAYHEITPTRPDPNRIRIIHHGIANFSRKIESMIELMDYLDERYSLDLMLMTPTQASKKTREYIGKLKELTSNNPKVNIIEPVRSDEIVDKIQDYDIGLFLLEPITFNYAHALPNKFFEFVQARLAVAIGPSIEMEIIAQQYGCGIVSEDFSAKTLADKIAGFSAEDLYQLKLKADVAARELHSENNRKKILQIMSDLI